jgi:hypothetical protein
MAATKFKSSHYVPHGDKIDPDAWVTSKDSKVMVQAWEHDDRPNYDWRWIETITWDGRAGKAGRFIITVYDRQTGQAHTAVNQFMRTAEQQAKTAAGMP